jgi:purine nucleosidase
MADWIIDTDAGVDDIQALVIALRNPQCFNLLGVTVVVGNIPLQQASKNVAECLRVCGREDVPYFNGAARPIISEPVGAEGMHGADGLNGYWAKNHGSNEPALKPAEALPAALAIVKFANENKPLNIVTLGPLTNLALALMIDPELPSKLGRVIVMGGAVNALGNVTVCAEFNVHFDPEASHIVFERLPKLELLSWECAINPLHQFDESFLNAYTQSLTAPGSLIKDIVHIVEGKSFVFFCDPMTICVALDPSVVLESSERHCQVELTGARTRGMLVVNWGSSDVSEINCSSRLNAKIVQRLDMRKVEGIFLASVA